MRRELRFGLPLCRPARCRWSERFWAKLLSRSDEPKGTSRKLLRQPAGARGRRVRFVSMCGHLPVPWRSSAHPAIGSYHDGPNDARTARPDADEFRGAAGRRSAGSCRDGSTRRRASRRQLSGTLHRALSIQSLTAPPGDAARRSNGWPGRFPGFSGAYRRVQCGDRPCPSIDPVRRSALFGATAGQIGRQ